jgi:hypothetical protein
VIETPEHLLFTCKKFDEHRYLLFSNNIRKEDDLKRIISDDNIIEDFKKFCKIIILKKAKI